MAAAESAPYYLGHDPLHQQFMMSKPLNDGAEQSQMSFGKAGEYLDVHLDSPCASSRKPTAILFSTPLAFVAGALEADRIQARRGASSASK
jgi:hypothetical protein